jgi:hypothetical protein
MKAIIAMILATAAIIVFNATHHVQTYNCHPTPEGTACSFTYVGNR